VLNCHNYVVAALNGPLKDSAKNFSLLNSIILGKKEFVNSKIRICVNCGNSAVFQNQQSIMCKDCGNVGYFSN